MRRLILTALVALLTACSSSKRDDAPVPAPAPNSQVEQTPATGQISEKLDAPADHNPREVVERAMQVHGGPVRLGKWKQFSRQEKGEIGQAIRGTRETFMAVPEKCRFNFELDTGTQKLNMSLILSGDKSWRASGGEVKDLSKDDFENFRGEAQLNSAAITLPIINGSGELTALPPILINKEPALGIKVSSKGNPDLKLYFDKKTGYLVKAERPGSEAGVAVTREYYYSDFKDFDGVKLPAKQIEHMNGRKIAEWTVTEYKAVDSLPADAFTKP